MVRGPTVTVAPLLGCPRPLKKSGLAEIPIATPAGAATSNVLLDPGCGSRVPAPHPAA
jgi:hypothetical protein